MQQCLLAILVAATLLFTGCGGSGDSTPTGKNTINLTTDGIRPSMLNLISSMDGTLNLTVADPADGTDPLVAMSKLDGWSLSQPIILEMGSANGNDLAQPAFSTEPGAIQPIYLLQVSYNNKDKVPTGLADILMPGTDFSALASGKSLYIIPLKPLAPGSYYSIILTNRLKDSTGQALSASDAYVNARNSASTATADLAAKALIGAQEAIAARVGIAQADLVLTDTFRTTSSGDSLRMLKLAASNIVTKAINANRTTTATDVWSTGDSFGTTTLGGIYDINFGAASGSLTQVLTDSSTSPQGAAGDSRLSTGSAAALYKAIQAVPALAGVAAITQVYKTTVKLPYFLSNTALHPQAPLFMAWRGSSPSLVSIVNGIDAGGDTATAITNALATRGVDATTLKNLFNDSTKKGELATEVIKLAGLNISVPDGNGGTQNLDSERNVTTFNALPSLTVLTDVPLLLFSPVPLANVHKVVIFQHGITSVKENAYPIVTGIIASGLAAGKNIAVAAIDLPLHGERGFPGIITDSANPGVYANLEYLATARDNVRQSAADLLGLRAALAFANRKAAPTLGTANNLKVGFIGHSLGGIVGTNFVAIANEISNYVGLDNSMFKIDETVLAMAGSQLAHIMLQSPAFGPIVTHDVVTGANAQLLEGFTAFKPLCENSNEKTCFTTQFVPSLPAETQAEIASTLQKFIFAAQTVLDAADPLGIAGSIVATNPLYFIEVVGDKANNLADQVVPNAAGLAGSESLIRELGLADLNATVTGTVRHVGRFNKGGHGSIIAPDAIFDPLGLATAEMQAQVGTLFAADGVSLPINNPNVICLGTAANCLP